MPSAVRVSLLEPAGAYASTSAAPVRFQPGMLAPGVDPVLPGPASASPFTMRFLPKIPWPYAAGQPVTKHNAATRWNVFILQNAENRSGLVQASPGKTNPCRLSGPPRDIRAYKIPPQFPSTDQCGGSTTSLLT